MLGRILSFMLYIFVGVNTIWFVVCDDGSGFLTTIGFGDKFISISKWAVNATMHFAHSITQ